MKTIPAPLNNLDYVKEWIRPRVSAKRFAHIAAVADSARQLAARFSADTEFIYQAELAGWLHDACKEIQAKLLIQQAKEYGMKLHPIEEANGHLLHGPVAAQLVKHTFDLQNKDVLNAIAEHTLGAVNMCLLSKIVFLADAIEPGRNAEYAGPIRAEIENSKGEDDLLALDRAILVACNSGLKHLLETNKAIHPRTVEVRNYYLNLIVQLAI